MSGIFFDIGIIIIIATAFGFIARLLKQPLIPIYILSGIFLGPIGLGVVSDAETIKTLAEIGIAFLLFMVGMELDLKKLKDIGLIASVGTVFRVIIIFALGFLLMAILGFTSMISAYIALIISFSSTMVVVKLLSDKKELDTLHGRIIIGILLMEDVLAIMVLSALPSISNFSFFIFFTSLLKGLGLIMLAMIASRYVFPLLFKFAAKSQEILFLLSITACFSFGLLSSALGFSIAIGAFVAGVALANLPYHTEIASRIRSLRDFFSTLFFVSLGMELTFINIGSFILPIIGIVILIIFIKPLIITISCSLFGYKRKTAFMTSASLTQISEFGLIIAAQGMLLGHIGQEILSLATIVAVVTISLTTYLIKFDDKLYDKLSNRLKIFENLSRHNKELHYFTEENIYNVILVGYDRIGYSIFRKLHLLKKGTLIVDFNPDIIKKLIREKIPCVYGDIGDVETVSKMNLGDVEWLISTIPDHTSNILLIKKLKEVNREAHIIVTSYFVDEALELYDMGADYVILPHLLGGEHVSFLLEEVSSNIDKLIDTKLEHIKELRRRKHVHHHT